MREIYKPIYSNKEPNYSDREFLDWLDQIKHLMYPTLTVYEARLMYERKLIEEARNTKAYY